MNDYTSPQGTPDSSRLYLGEGAPEPRKRRPLKWLIPLITGILGLVLGFIFGVGASASVSTSTAISTSSPAESVSPSESEAASTETPSAVEPEVTESVSPSPSNDGVALNDRGNFSVAVGKSAHFGGSLANPMVTVTVNEIIPDFQCTQQGAEAPKNGRLVAMKVTVKTSKGLVADSQGNKEIDLLSFTWDYYSKSGQKSNTIKTNATYNCVDTTLELTDSAGPSETVTGYVLIDVPSIDGWVVFDPTWASGPKPEWKLTK